MEESCRGPQPVKVPRGIRLSPVGASGQFIGGREEVGPDD
jgi:hypothetical protein